MLAYLLSKGKTQRLPSLQMNGTEPTRALNRLVTVPSPKTKRICHTVPVRGKFLSVHAVEFFFGLDVP
jgi:hypothetical protein